MNSEIEKLIKYALADGELTEKERAVIMRKAKSLGEDLDEVEMIIDGEIAFSSEKQNKAQINFKTSNKAGNLRKCPSCGATVPSLSLRCEDCGHEFNKESDSNKEIRDYIKELENQLHAVDKEKFKLLGGRELSAIEYPTAANNKKAQIINAFTLPNTKESLIQLLIFSYSNYEAVPDDALLTSPIKKAWLGKAIQAYKLLNSQKEGDKKIHEIIEEYSFLDSNNSKKSSKKDQIEKVLNHKSNSFLKKFILYGGIILGAIMLIPVVLLIIIPLFFGSLLWFNSGKDPKTNKIEIVIDSLISIDKVNEAKNEVNKLKNENEKKSALDKIKIYEFNKFLENNDNENAKNKANSIQNEYEKNNALDKILMHEVEKLIELNKFDLARSKANLINYSYGRQETIDKVLIVEIDKLIEKQDFKTAILKAKQINFENTRNEEIKRINNSKN